MVWYRIDFVGFVVILRIPRESFEGRWPYFEDQKKKKNPSLSFGVDYSI
jgi:hypothetical protein